MQTIQSDAIISYISNFVTIFFVCLMGSFTRDIFDTIVKLNKINIKKIVISAIFITIVLMAVFEYWSVESLGLIVFLCFFSGLWSFKLLKLALDQKVVTAILKNIFKNSKDTLSKALTETINDVEDEKSKKNRVEDNSTANDKNDTS